MSQAQRALLGELRDQWKFVRHGCRDQVPEYLGLLELGLTSFGQFDRHDSFVNGVTQAVHDARAVEVDAGRRFVLDRVEAGALRERFVPAREAVPAKRLKQWVSGSDPFEVVLLRCLSLGGDARVVRGNARELPGRVAFEDFQCCGCAPWPKRVIKFVDRLQ